MYCTRFFFVRPLDASHAVRLSGYIAIRQGAALVAALSLSLPGCEYSTAVHRGWTVFLVIGAELKIN